VWVVLIYGSCFASCSSGLTMLDGDRVPIIVASRNGFGRDADEAQRAEDPN
jgi:hypothetical protein